MSHGTKEHGEDSINDLLLTAPTIYMNQCETLIDDVARPSPQLNLGEEYAQDVNYWNVHCCIKPL